MWPYGLIAFFVVFISWIAIFIGIAVNNASQLVGADYYEQEIRYQERIDSIRRLDRLTGFELNHDPGAETLTIQLPDGHSGPAVSGHFQFYRPDNVGLDRRGVMQPLADGRQVLSLAGLVSGNWKFEASWEVDGKTYFASTNLHLAGSVRR